MLTKISDPSFQTVLFSVIFLSLLLVSVRKSEEESFLSRQTTNQLKGFAILAVVFSHIGFFLYTDQKFLYPYSILAGVGVNIFLFLSGFGLTISQLKSPLSPFSFYKKRLLKLFIPLWIVITTFLLIDFFVLDRTYPLSEIINGFLGFYPRADVFQNLDSPLWYFSVILFYYLIFPLIFVKKIPLLSPVLVLLLSLLVLKLPLPVDPDVLKLYKLHFLAFPLGMFFGIIQNVILRPFSVILSAAKDLKTQLRDSSANRLRMTRRILRMTILILSVLVFLYTSIHSGVGQGPNIEQSISLITSFSILIIFALSKLEFRLFSLLGIYSYEIYLLHWPILSRFNPFLSLPPFLMVILNLFLFLLLSFALQKIIRKAAS